MPLGRRIASRSTRASTSSDSTANVVDAMLGGVVTNATGHTIRGAGRLLDHSGGMINTGTLRAEDSTRLAIDPGTGQSSVNGGTMQAVGAGGLAFSDGTFVNTGQTLEVGTGSRLDLNNGTTLMGGR